MTAVQNDHRSAMRLAGGEEESSVDAATLAVGKGVCALCKTLFDKGATTQLFCCRAECQVARQERRKHNKRQAYIKRQASRSAALGARIDQAQCRHCQQVFSKKAANQLYCCRAECQVVHFEMRKHKKRQASRSAVVGRR
jgi:hypothetical protein